MNLVKKQRKILIEIHIIIFLLISSIYLILNTNMIKYVTPCIFYKKYDLLCPGCGGTRFMLNLINLNFVQAFYIHLVFFILIIYLFILDITYVINIFLHKNIQFFKCWHVILWTALLLIFTVLRNINF